MCLHSRRRPRANLLRAARLMEFVSFDACGLERVQEIHEIGFLLLGKTDSKSLVIEVHGIL
jgi:hypothetical protein